MRLDGYATAVVGDGSILRVDSEGLAVWTAYAETGMDGNMAWFDFSQGNVAVKNPDSAILEKMWRIARKLGAKVQGDDGEEYGADGGVVG